MDNSGFLLSFAALEGVTFIGFRGTEQLSQPYEFELYFTVPTGTDVRRAVGERATLRVSRGAAVDPLTVHGILANVRLLHQTAGRALYQALLVPKLWLLRHFVRSYVFTHQSITDFLASTLKDGGLTADEVRFSIDEGSYPKEEFVAQYRETHLAFFHRWLEREGLYYYFEHPSDGDNEVLVIADDKSLHDAFPGGGRARYFPITGDDATGPLGLHHLEQEVQWLPRSVTIADYNYAKPSARVTGESRVTPNGLGAIREYGFRVFVKSEAERLAEVRAQSIACREVILRASGNAIGLRAGYTVALDDQPSDVAEEWLVIEAHHAGSIAGITPEVARLTGLSDKLTYRIKILAIPRDTQFRAPQATPWPRVYGFENAVVCGPADSEYAQIDADGRYLVRFEFDTSGLPDARISTRVRMMQPHGGTTEGFHFPLRKGTEVMVAFLGGDPDRPFIAGVVPNAQKPSVVGERNHTQNILRTGSGNQLVLEDERGKEFIFIHTPNNRTGVYMGTPSAGHASVYTGDGEAQVGTFNSPGNANPNADDSSVDQSFSYLETTAGDGGSWIGGDAWENVGGSKSSFVSGDLWVGVGATYRLEVGAAATESYYASRTTTTDAGRTDTVSGGKKQTVSGGMTQTVIGGLTQTTRGGMTHDIQGGLTQTIKPGGSQAVTGPWMHKVSAENHDDYGTWKTDVGGTWTGEFGGDVSLTGAANFKIEAPMAKITASDLKIEIAGLTFHKTPSKHELFVYKGQTGVIKADHAAIAQQAYGLKIETSLIKLDYFALDKKTAGPYLRNAALSVILSAAIMRGAAAYVRNAGFTKI